MADNSDINISVIRLYDPLCISLVDKSPSTHVYSFSESENSWVKSKISGVFFLYKRSKIPFHCFMILNRKSPTINQIEGVTTSLRLQLHSPFLLYQTAKGEIFSVWFYSPEDCVRISERLGKMVYELGGFGLRVAQGRDKFPAMKTGCKYNNLTNESNQPKQLTTQGIVKLMDIVHGSTDVNSGDGASSTPIPSSSSRDRHTPGRSNGVYGKSKLQSHSETSQAPNLFDLLHKAEVDFKSEQVTGLPCGSNLTNELQRLRSVCNIPPSDKDKDTTSFTKFKSSNSTKSPSAANAATSKGKVTLVTSPAGSGRPNLSAHVQPSNHISVTELEQKLLSEHSNPDGLYFRGDHPASDDSSDDHDELASAAQSSNQVLPPTTPNSRTRSQLLSDLDTGYADDIDEDTVTVPMRNGQLGRRKPNQQKLPPHQRRHAARLAQIGSALALTTMSSGLQVPPRQEAEGIDESDDVLVTPSMLSSLASAGVTPLTPTLSNQKIAVGAPASSNDQKELHGLTPDQLKEALIYALQNDDDFVHRIHTAYICALQRKLSLH